MKERFLRAALRARLPNHAALITRLPPSPADRLALTFDDGPDPSGTPAVLDALGEVGARATFFVLAERAEANPALLERIAGMGHTVGIHGDRHEALDAVAGAEAIRRLADAKRDVEDRIGRPVEHFRPPYGRMSATLSRAAAEVSLDVVLWSRDPRDWDEKDPVTLSRRLVTCLEPRAIVLLHDGGTDGHDPGGTTADALRSVANELAAFELVGLT